MTIIDSHVHLWDPARLRYSWLTGAGVLERAYLPSDFAAATAGLGVSGLVVVEAGCDPESQAAEPDWLISLCRDQPLIRAVVAHAALERGVAVRPGLERLAGFAVVKGVRRLLQGEDAGFCLRPDFVAGVRQLADFGFTFDVCIRSDQLPQVIELVRQVPEVSFVLDHLGKPPIAAGAVQPWRNQLLELGGLPNVSCKLSGLTTEAAPDGWNADGLAPYVETAIEAFGYERLLYGSDWPVCLLATSYQRWTQAVSGWLAGATQVERAAVLGGNAARVYRL